MAKNKSETEGDTQEEPKAKSGLSMNVEEVLIPSSIGTVKYGSEEIEIKPMSFGSALKIAKFITKNFGRAFNSESFQRAKQDPTMTSMEMWIGVATEFLVSLEESEVIEILCDLTQKDKEFIKKNFSLLGLTKVLKTVYFTEDFQEIFLELGTMMGETKSN